jgi:hypothetical protein
MDSMVCPVCRKLIWKQKHEDQFLCSCGWKSNLFKVEGIKYDSLRMWLRCRDEASEHH